MCNKIAVLGAGNGGYAFSVHLSLQGNRVNLFEAPEFKSNIQDIETNGGIEALGEVQGFSKIHKVSTDMGETLEDVDHIIVPVPAFAQDYLFEKMLPFLKKGQVILLCPDNTGSLRLYKLLKENAMERDIFIAGTSTLLYVAKRDGLSPGQVNIGGVKKEMQISTMPSKAITEIVEILDRLIPAYKIGDDVLSTSLSNLNHQLHPGPMILNAGRIESPEDFLFYREGHTESIHRVVEGVDEEKYKVGEALGLKIAPLKDVFTAYYNGCSYNTETLHAMIKTNSCYREVIAPPSLTSRFLVEDLMYGLVLISSIGERFKIKTPTIDSLIHIASVLNNVDYREEGMTLDRLGLDSMDREEIHRYLKEG